MKVTLLLPMKGNSERVPNKNLKLFNEKPLFHAIIDELITSKYINKVIINTDGDLIAESAINTFQNFVSIHKYKLPYNKVIRKYSISFVQLPYFMNIN